ncbi:MAG: succinate dehydrogenase cytochrome b subunit [Flavobacteriales bacterium]
MSNKEFLTSSLAKKFVMAATGLFLISFLVIHVSINSLIFLNDGGETFNTAAHFMSHNIVVRILEVGLFVGLLMHIYQAWVLTQENRKARPVQYAVSNETASKWYSRSMGILGSLLLIFLVVHLANFWYPTKVAVATGDENHNTYKEMKEIFSPTDPDRKDLYKENLTKEENEKKYNEAVEEYEQKSTMALVFAGVYLLGVFSLGYHLLHGFQSAFQSLGFNHKKYSPMISAIGTGFSIVVPLIFALMPLAFLFGILD